MRLINSIQKKLPASYIQIAAY